MSGPSFHLRLPPLSLFKFPPDPQPPALPPPANTHTFASPFTIEPKLYNDALSVWVPIGVSAFYFVMVTLWNAVNRRRQHKPYAVSQTRIFSALVILHNVFLALFSALTFVAMMRALRHVWPGRLDRIDYVLGIPWPAFRTEHGLAGAADALCKMQGPRGLGNAALYVPSKGSWEIKNQAFKLAGEGTPDPTDLGRLWNEGLAFWGWWFYLSKFYEVFDTIIILLKGKRSSTLQTYHHAGAMWCMWAGIRFMSSPIWMFVWMNSLIHALMYTYYTVAAFGIRVPQVLKRTLTTAQISQFLLGFTFAAFHLFVSYTVPVATPYTITTKVLSAVSNAAEAVASRASEIAHPTVTAGVFDLLKKIALRAAGEEGLAENVRNAEGSRFGPEATAVEKWENMTETLYRDEWHEVSCIDTTGQSFAIWLNLIYLLPLTALFVRFFVKSYTRRTAAASKAAAQSKQPQAVKAKAKAHAHAAREATLDAAAGVESKVEHVGKGIEREAERVIDHMERSSSPSSVREIAGKFEKRVQAAVEAVTPEGGSPNVVRKVRSQSKMVQEKANQILANGKNGVKSAADETAKTSLNTIEAIEKKGVELAERVMQGGWEGKKKKVDESWDMLESKVLDGKEEAKSVTDEVAQKAEESVEKSKAEADGNAPSEKKSADVPKGKEPAKEEPEETPTETPEATPQKDLSQSEVNEGSPSKSKKKKKPKKLERREEALKEQPKEQPEKQPEVVKEPTKEEEKPAPSKEEEKPAEPEVVEKPAQFKEDEKSIPPKDEPESSQLEKDVTPEPKPEPAIAPEQTKAQEEPKEEEKKQSSPKPDENGVSQLIESEAGKVKDNISEIDVAVSDILKRPDH